MSDDSCPLPRWYRLLPDGSTEPLTGSFEERVMEGARLFENSGARTLGWDVVGEARVSTVFLVLDHAWRGEPVLFETMVFGGPMDQEQQRYRTFAEAMAGHAAMVERVREATKELEHEKESGEEGSGDTGRA